MEPQEYRLMFEVELHHWWYLGMAKITRALLNKWRSHTPDISILDAGCGTGAAMSSFLTDYGNVTGVDVSPLALGFCQTRNLKRLVLASVSVIPFQSDSFDLVTSFDVLYERTVPSDLAAVTEFFRVLRPGGFVLLRLPAYDWLRGQHDLTVHTARRYTVSQVTRLLTDSGFSLLHISYANTFLFPLAVAKRLLERIRPHTPVSSDLSVKVGVFNELFKTILGSEAFFVSGIGLPFGLSVIALAQKPHE